MKHGHGNEHQHNGRTERGNPGAVSETGNQIPGHRAGGHSERIWQLR